MRKAAAKKLAEEEDTKIEERLAREMEQMRLEIEAEKDKAKKK